MSTEAIGAMAPATSPPAAVGGPGDGDANEQKCEAARTTGLHSPPESNNAAVFDGSDSELSDLEDIIADQLREEALSRAPPLPSSEPPAQADEDIGEIFPDHYSGTVPVFKPTMKQFQNFKLFMGKIDSYGMKSGIVKVIPPQEWKESLPRVDDLVKQIRVRDPIKQDIMGSNGTYRQVNILHQRSYNLPQWRQLCDQSEHQPPARRGERRANAEKPKPKAAPKPRATGSSRAPKAAPTKSKRGRRPGRKSMPSANEETVDAEERPMTPVSPKPDEEEPVPSVEKDLGVKEEFEEEDDVPVVRRMGGIIHQPKAKTQSTSARRKYIRREGSAMIDEAAFKDFDYAMDVSDYTPERCEELERTYWRTLTYAPPLYGADLPGTLFHESNDTWNLNKLPNLLDVLGTKVPGVNTAYLYLGMWKATFAWHLEDVDLYSINYLHFGAPKQWYSISQGDARRFEAAMKNIWPTEAKACDQFLRHKGFLISPAHLKQHYNITVNKCVSYPGEFVVTYPYGYHSGYNLGYNCAEAVNFALDSWLPMGKIAKRCQCAQAQDSVWVDVYEIERKLRGESTEYEETEDEEDEDEVDEEEAVGLPTPPSRHTIKLKSATRKRKRAAGEKEGKKKVKKIRLRPKTRAEPPCCLCPNDIPGAEILSTVDGRKAHRMCALYVPETYIETVDGTEIVANVSGINKARLDLKCLYCRSKKGACFQCSQKKCARSYHATCAAAAGVFVEEAEVPVFGDDGTEYKEQAFEFSCRFHRIKRDKRHDGDALEDDVRILEAAAALKQGAICQMQFYRGDIFAGVVVETRHDEQTLLLDIIPGGDRVEVEWKWLLLPDPSEFRLPKASANALPMPTTRKAKEEINARRPADELPRKHDTFVEGFTWAEFHSCPAMRNPAQVKIDMAKENQIWHYLGGLSTESKAKYTDDISKPQHNPKSSFLDSIPKPVVAASMPPPPQPRRSFVEFQTPHVSTMQLGPKTEKPYEYKPRKPSQPGYTDMRFTPQTFAPKPPVTSAPHLPTYSLPEQRPRPARQQLYQAKDQAPVGMNPPTHGPPPFKPLAADRFAPVGGSNGFPQLPGLTCPPAHMTSGHYSQAPPRAWSSSSSAAYPTPMTSSVLKSSGSVRPVSTYQKYSFFQVHHNRDSSRYRSPYAPHGGFADGYRRNHREFVIRANRVLSGKEPSENGSSILMRPVTSQKEIPTPSARNTVTFGQQSSHSAASSSRVRNDVTEPEPPLFTTPQRVEEYHPTLGGSDQVQASRSAPLHPAIRPQYGGTWHNTFLPGQANSEIRQPVTDAGGAGQRRTPSKLTSARWAHASATAKPSPVTKQSYSPIPLPSYAQQPTKTAVDRPPPVHQVRPSYIPLSPHTSHPPLVIPSGQHDPQLVPRVEWTNQVMTYSQQPRASQGEYPEPLSPRDTTVPAGPSITHAAPYSAHQQPQSYQGNHPETGQWNTYQVNHAVPAPGPAPKPAEELIEVPTESSALLEQMMANLRRASGTGPTSVS